jgi:hypothetical protein
MEAAKRRIAEAPECGELPKPAILPSHRITGDNLASDITE